MNGESGCRIELTCARTDGRSFIQCRDNELSTASKVFGSYGRVSGDCKTSLVIEISSLKGRSASRCRSEYDGSAAVIFLMRVASGTDTGFVEYSSGSRFVRIREMLQAFAPRSRT